jgi:hypothetical protein
MARSLVLSTHLIERPSGLVRSNSMAVPGRPETRKITSASSRMETVSSSPRFDRIGLSVPFGDEFHAPGKIAGVQEVAPLFSASPNHQRIVSTRYFFHQRRNHMAGFVIPAAARAIRVGRPYDRDFHAVFPGIVFGLQLGHALRPSISGAGGLRILPHLPSALLYAIN